MLSETALVMVRKSIELGYIGTCNIIEFKEVLNEDKSSSFQEVIVYEDIPCKLSFSNSTTTNDNGTASSVNQIVKLFIAPEILIKPNSKIVVNQNNIVETYSNSGQPLTFSTHQEIMLNLFKEWS